MKYTIIALGLMVGSGLVGQQSTEWHVASNMTASQKASKSYKFLVSKFGANHILSECSPSMAASMGDDFLIEVYAEGSASKVGLATVHGRNLQGALDDAAESYISPERYAAAMKNLEKQTAERNKREQEFRKQCCPAKGASK